MSARRSSDLPIVRPLALLLLALALAAPAEASQVQLFSGGGALRSGAGPHEVVASGTGVHASLNGTLGSGGGLAHIAWDGAVTEPIGPATWGASGPRGLARTAGGSTVVGLGLTARAAVVTGTTIASQLALEAGADDVAVDHQGTRWISVPEKQQVVQWPLTGLPQAYAFAPVAGIANTPSSLTVDGTGQVWVALHGTQRLGVLDPASPTPTWRFVQLPAESKVRELALGPDGRVWGTDEKLDALHAVHPTTLARTTYPYGRAKMELGGVVGGPDGLLYFAVPKGDAIGRMRPDGTVLADLPLGLGDQKAQGLAVGGDGNVWFTVKGTPGHVGRVWIAPGASAVGAQRGGDGVVAFRATVHPRGRATTWKVQFGPTAALGQETSAVVQAAGPSAVTVTAAVPGGTSGTVHARLVATSASGTTTGPTAVLDLDAAAAPPADPPPPPTDPVPTTSAPEPTVAPIPVTPVTVVEEPPPTIPPTTAVTTTDQPPVTVPVTPVVPKEPAEDADGFDLAGRPGLGGGAAPPVLGRSVALAPGSGKVLITLPGRATPVALGDDDDLPIGTLVDVRAGRVVLRSAIDAAGTPQTAEFWGGVFAVQQAAGRTQLHLRGPAPDCGRRFASAAKRPRKRRLWGKDDNGKFSTHGRDAVATTRGTQWLVEETCAGTTVRVTEGAVQVTARRSGRKVLVRAGRSHVVPRVR